MKRSFINLPIPDHLDYLPELHLFISFSFKLYLEKKIHIYKNTGNINSMELNELVTTWVTTTWVKCKVTTWVTIIWVKKYISSTLIVPTSPSWSNSPPHHFYVHCFLVFLHIHHISMRVHSSTLYLSFCHFWPL